MYVQARQALANLKHHIESAGFSLAEVIRTRVFVTDISRLPKSRARIKKYSAIIPPPRRWLKSGAWCIRIC